MVELALYLAALLLLIFFVIRKGANPTLERTPLAVWLARAALVLIAFYIAFFLFFAVGELFSGDISGVSHLAPAILVAGIAILANKRPLAGGLILIGLSILLSIYLVLPIRSGVSLLSSAVLIVGLPLFLAGMLFLASALVILQQRRKNASDFPTKVG